ncbi:MAG: holo-ACP synthase [Kiritimatiellaeota bacterium]|nr:holo-ACP synthase [Kiritimatiellota bacterium]
MLIGIGTDIVEIKRIAEMLEEHGEAFLNKIFTPAEIAESDSRSNPSIYLAGRWAVKEAVSKALGCGFGVKCSWRDIETTNLESGRPITTLSGKASETAAELAADQPIVSISHEHKYACATVAIEKK